MKFLNNLKLKKFRKGQKGFTLIELLVVIAILGVIAAVAVPNILSFIGEGDTEAAKAELHNVTVAVSAAMYENGGNLSNAIGSSETPVQITTSTAEVGPFLINDTQWTYHVTVDGDITQGAKVS